MATITEQQQTRRAALETAQTREGEATSRTVKQIISDLDVFQLRHHKPREAPSRLELFCDLNPSDNSCFVYDD